MREYFDLNIVADNPKEILETSEALGWTGICLRTVPAGITKLQDRLAEFKTSVKTFTAVAIDPDLEPDPVRRAQNAIRLADFAYALGGGYDTNRKVCEIWELDMLCHPERSTQKDFMRYRNSGLNHTTAKLLTEHGISVEFNLSEVLKTYGRIRSIVLGRMRQNIIVARKYGCNMILTSGADNKWGLCSPRDMISFGVSLGMTADESKDAVSKNPLLIIKKSKDRRDPNIILKGLEVIEWGDQEKKEKRMFGWY